MELSIQQRMELAQTAKTPGFAIWLDIGDKICMAMLAETLNVRRSKGATADQVMAAQEEAGGARILFERWQDEGNKQTSGIGAGIEAVAEEEMPAEEPIAEFRLDKELRQSAYGKAATDAGTT